MLHGRSERNTRHSLTTGSKRPGRMPWVAALQNPTQGDQAPYIWRLQRETDFSAFCSCNAQQRVPKATLSSEKNLRSDTRQAQSSCQQPATDIHSHQEALVLESFTEAKTSLRSLCNIISEYRLTFIYNTIFRSTHIICLHAESE